MKLNWNYKINHIIMSEPRPTSKKSIRPITLVESRKQGERSESFNIQNSYLSRAQQRNENINASLNSNYNQIKQLMRERKNLLKNKYQSMIIKNRDKLNSIGQARDQDLRNQAKMLNDKSIIDIVDHAESLQNSKSLIRQISDIKDMNHYQAFQRNLGKQFWDKSKQFEREKKKKAEAYASNARQLQDLNQKERIIFTEIEKCETQIKYHLTKGRNQPDHVTRAERLNEEIERKKGALREIKAQKTKLKSVIQNVIDDILQYNNGYQKFYKNRFKQLDQIFAGTEDLAQFDNLLAVFEKIIQNKLSGGTRQVMPVEKFNQTLIKYDHLLQHVEKMKEQEDAIFTNVNQDLKDRIKTAILEKSFFSGVPLKLNHQQLQKRLKDYRRLLYDFTEERPRIEKQINKMGQMNTTLYPIKKAYETEDDRREDLKRELRRLLLMSADLQAKQKEQRNFQFSVEELQHKRKVIQIDINDLAERVNLTEYKNKMKELEEINKKISEKNDVVLQNQIKKMTSDLQQSFDRLYDNYEDLIIEVQIQDQDLTLSVLISKLEKRLSLV